MCPLGRAEVTALPDGEEGPHDLHVLLRHRLLRQAQGFESLGTVGVCAEVCDQPFTEASDPRRFYVKGGTAATSAPSNVSQGKNPSAAVSDLLDLPSEVLPTLVH